MPDRPAHLVIGDEDVRVVQPREVESLTRRSAYGAAVRDFLRERGKDDVPAAGIDEILVDLVRHHKDVVPQADFSQFLKFLFRPHASDRIVRRAEDEEFHAVLNDLAFEVLKVDGVPFPVETQFVHDGPAAVVADPQPETVIDRLLDQDRVAHLRETADQRADRKHHARRQNRRMWIDRPVVPCFEPRCERLEIGLVGIGIPEDPVGGKGGKGFPHGGRRLKIHVRHPHGEQVFRLAVLFRKIVFEAFGVAAGNDFVKIVLHPGFSQVHFSIAERRSSMRSAAFSIPTEIRRKRSLMPRLRRSSSGTSAWV